MNIDFKQLIIKNFIFLFIFNTLFFILLLFFFNNVSNGKVYILDIKVSMIELMKNNNDKLKDNASRNINPSNYFKKEIDKLDLHRNKIIIDFYQKYSNENEFVLKFYTYDDSIKKNQILKIYNNIFNNVSMKMNNNFNEILKNIIIDEEFYLTKMLDFLNVAKNIKINAIEKNINLIINNKINEYRNQLDLIELNQNSSTLKKLHDEGFRYQNRFDLVRRIDDLAYKKELFNYLDSDNQNTIYDIKIINLNERNIFMDKFSYLFIFFGNLISIMISLLFLIYVNNRELKTS